MLRLHFEVSKEVCCADEVVTGKLTFTRYKNPPINPEDLGSCEVELKKGSTTFSPWKGAPSDAGRYLPDILRDREVHEAAMRLVTSFYAGWMRDQGTTHWLEEEF